MKPQRKRIVIVGANFAGLSAAVKLSQDCAVTVIDPSKHFEWIPNIHELLSGVKTAQSLRLDRTKIVARAGHRFVRDRVVGLESGRGVVVTEAGREVPYDACIMAVGGTANTHGVRGASQHAQAFRGVADCEAIGRSLCALHKLKEPMRLVIVGGGISGVEALGEILRRYGNHPALSIDLVEGAARLLSGFPAGIDADLRKICEPYPVQWHMNSRIASVSPKGVRLQDGRRIASALTLWTAGLAPPPLLRSAGLAQGHDVWAPVSRTLQSVYAESVFVIGDAASLPKPVVKQAFHAIDMGTCAALNAQRYLQGRSLQVFKPAPKPLVIAFGDLQTYLVAGRAFVANRALAAAKEGLYQVFMAQMAPQGVLQTLPGVADRLIQSWEELLRPQLRSI